MESKDPTVFTKTYEEGVERVLKVIFGNRYIMGTDILEKDISWDRYIWKWIYHGTDIWEQIYHGVKYMDLCQYFCFAHTPIDADIIHGHVIETLFCTTMI